VLFRSHWLPLFYEKLDSFFDYAKNCHIVIGHNVLEAVHERLDQINDHYDARLRSIDGKLEGGTPYKPVEPNSLYLDEDEIKLALDENLATILSPFETIETGKTRVVSLGGKQSRNFAVERSTGANVFEAVIAFAAEERSLGKKVMIACWSTGSCERLSGVLAEHGMGNIQQIENFGAFDGLGKGKTALGVLPLEHGFSTDELSVIAEQDILGDRLVRRSKRKKGSDIISEAASLGEGDIVVHVDHGIARFIGLKTIEAAGAPHDCLELHYLGDDKLFLPVENIELLSRFGNADSEVQLDRLGGAAWQARKAKLKARIRVMAENRKSVV